MNIMQMMQQAQKMQKKLQEAQDELTKMEVSAKSAEDLVEITVDGQGKIKGVKIKPEALDNKVDQDTLETLEDLLFETIKSAQESAKDKMEAKMKTVTGGVSIPGLF